MGDDSTADLAAQPATYLIIDIENEHMELARSFSPLAIAKERPGRNLRIENPIHHGQWRWKIDVLVQTRRSD